MIIRLTDKELELQLQGKYTCLTDYSNGFKKQIA